MNEVWCVNYKHKLKLFKKREDAEKFVFNIEYKYYKKRLIQEKEWTTKDQYNDYKTVERKEWSLRLKDRALEYLENILSTPSTWQEKNNRLNEKGILWQTKEEQEKSDKECKHDTNDDVYVGFGSVILCNDSPYLSIELLPVE